MSATRRQIQHSCAARILIGVLSSILSMQPVFTYTLYIGISLPVWADPISDAAQQGQGFGQGLLTGPQTDGNQVYFDGNSGVESININEVFQGTGSVDDTADMQSAFGNAATADALNATINNRLETEASPQAEAFRAIRDSAISRSHPDMINDPAFVASREILDGDDPVFSTFFSGCNEVTVPAGGSSVHVPDLKYCDRVAKPVSSCELYHHYDAGVLRVLSGQGGVSSCGPGCLDLFVGKVGNNYWSGHCSIYEQATKIAIDNPAAITSARLVQATWDDYMQVYMNNSLVWRGPNSNFPPQTAGPCELSNSWNWSLNTNLTSHFQNNSQLDFLIRVSVTGGGEGYARIRLYYDQSKLIINDDWQYSAECEALFDGISDGACQINSMTCIDGPPMHVNCINVNGFNICKSDLSPAPVAGYSPLCRHGRIEANCNFFHGSLDCWTDPNGDVHCPTNTGGNENECAPYESDPACAFVESECIDGATGSTGRCYAFSETWDCGFDVGIPGSETTTISCGGPIRCMGEECVSPPRETNPDFGQASATLASLNFMAMDMNCPVADPSLCEIFSGDAYECKKALGGFVDCCDTPSGVSLADYMQLTMASWDFAKKINLGEKLASAGLDVPGAWNAMKNWTSSTFSQVTKPFTSSWGSLSQSLTGTVADGVESLSIDTLKSSITDSVGEWVYNSFGDQVGSMFFDPVVGSTGDVVGYQLGGPAITAVQTIMTAYMIYSIVNILAHIIWECEEKEFELGAKRELKSCHRVGSYCANDTIAGCVEKRDSYCCYSSPLARIVQEGARPQLGLGYGDARNPQCGGLTVADLAVVDWNQINFDEWYGLLASTGVIPDGAAQFDVQYSLEEATTNQFINTPVPNATERIEDRVNQAELNDARDKVRQDLWDGI